MLSVGSSVRKEGNVFDLRAMQVFRTASLLFGGGLYVGRPYFKSLTCSSDLQMLTAISLKETHVYFYLESGMGTLQCK